MKREDEVSGAELLRTYDKSLKQTQAQCRVYADRIYLAAPGIDPEQAERELQSYMAKIGHKDK